MHPAHIIIASMVISAQTSLVDADDDNASYGAAYIHPSPDEFTDFAFISPLPKTFVDAYPKRKEMGNQYLDFFGVIAIIGGSSRSR